MSSYASFSSSTVKTSRKSASQWCSSVVRTTKARRRRPLCSSRSAMSILLDHASLTVPSSVNCTSPLAKNGSSKISRIRPLMERKTKLQISCQRSYTALSSNGRTRINRPWSCVSAANKLSAESSYKGSSTRITTRHCRIFPRRASFWRSDKTTRHLTSVGIWRSCIMRQVIQSLKDTKIRAIAKSQLLCVIKTTHTAAAIGPDRYWSRIQKPSCAYLASAPLSKS